MTPLHSIVVDYPNSQKKKDIFVSTVTIGQIYSNLSLFLYIFLLTRYPLLHPNHPTLRRRIQLCRAPALSFPWPRVPAAEEGNSQGCKKRAVKQGKDLGQNWGDEKLGIQIPSKMRTIWGSKIQLDSIMG